VDEDRVIVVTAAHVLQSTAAGPASEVKIGFRDRLPTWFPVVRTRPMPGADVAILDVPVAYGAGPAAPRRNSTPPGTSGYVRGLTCAYSNTSKYEIFETARSVPVASGRSWNSRITTHTIASARVRPPRRSPAPRRQPGARSSPAGARRHRRARIDARHRSSP
jgi:hypothetical protein